MKLQCQICGRDLDLLDGFFSCSDVDAGEWQFVCADCPDSIYDFSTKCFFESPKETIGWLAHLYEKVWFKPDKFFEFMDRLRGSYEC